MIWANLHIIVQYRTTLYAPVSFSQIFFFAFFWGEGGLGYKKGLLERVMSCFMAHPILFFWMKYVHGAARTMEICFDEEIWNFQVAFRHGWVDLCSVSGPAGTSLDRMRWSTCLTGWALYTDITSRRARCANVLCLSVRLYVCPSVYLSAVFVCDEMEILFRYNIQDAG